MTLQQLIDMLIAQPASAKDIKVFFKDNSGKISEIGLLVEVNGGDTNYNSQGGMVNQLVAPYVYLTQK